MTTAIDVETDVKRLYRARPTPELIPTRRRRSGKAAADSVRPRISGRGSAARLLVST